MPPKSGNDVLKEAAETLAARAKYIKDYSEELEDYTVLTEELRSIREIKKKVLKELRGTEKYDSFHKKVEETEGIIIDLRLRLKYRSFDGFGNRLYDLSNSLKATAGILKVIAAIILTYNG